MRLCAERRGKVKVLCRLIRDSRGCSIRRYFKTWCPGWESNPHEEKSPEDFKSSASAIPPPGQGRYRKVACPARAFKENAGREASATPWEERMPRKQQIPRRFVPSE